MDTDEIRKAIEADDGPSLFKAIVENRRKLDACPKHLFDFGAPPYRLGQKHTCSHCGGSMQLTEIGSYIRGYIAHGGNPNDINPGWG